MSTHASDYDENAGGMVSDIDRFSSHDGPGIRTAVFLKGCPLRCVWCHSPETQKTVKQLLHRKARCVACYECIKACPHGAIHPHDATAPHGAVEIDRKKCDGCFTCVDVCSSGALSISGREMTAGAIVDLALRDKIYHDNSGGGVTVSGGEPLAQPDFTYNILKRCQQNGIHTAIETSGHGNECDLIKIAEVTDLIYYDIKHTDSTKHKELTGAGSEITLKNLKALCSISGMSDKVTVRTPCIPGVNDSTEVIESIANTARSFGIRRMELLAYNTMAGAKYGWLDIPYTLGELVPRDEGYIEMLRSLISQAGF